MLTALLRAFEKSFMCPLFLNLRRYTFFLIAAVISVTVACSGTKPLEVERGTEYNDSYHRDEDGHPELRLTAMGFLSETDVGVITVTADIENRSLIYRHLDGKTSADIEMAITIVGREGLRYIETYTETKTIENEVYGPLIFANITRYEKDIEVPPGRYAVYFSITDKASDSETIREVYTTVPDPGEEIVDLTSIQLFAKSPDKPEKEFEPITTYNVSTQTDSLRFVLQVANNRPGEPLLLRSRLIRFDSDTTSARWASQPDYSVSSLPYRGIDYRDEENVEQTQRILDQTGIVMIEFNYERPERGNYRFEVAAERADGEEEILRGRDFSVKGENFPRVESPRELAEPLVYLMNEREYEKMMAIEDPDKLKEAVDRFWLENVGSMNRAKEVISRYYERVEEANRQFTNFKEGWKTDRGMIYILFGPPVRIQRYLNAQQWLGSAETRDRRYNFMFRRTRIPSDHYPFDNYILQRNQAYHTYQYQQVQLWLTGRILNATM
jgi:GWxTD domain-containing protein